MEGATMMNLQVGHMRHYVDQVRVGDGEMLPIHLRHVTHWPKLQRDTPGLAARRLLDIQRHEHANQNPHHLGRELN